MVPNEELDVNQDFISLTKSEAKDVLKLKKSLFKMMLRPLKSDDIQLDEDKMFNAIILVAETDSWESWANSNYHKFFN